ncbi:MAG: hypothetical protein AAF349_07600 [Cyanobacteria bacterium P01_A01_bin.68]
MSQSQINELIEIAVGCCYQRNPELLDEIFDNLPIDLNKHVIMGTVAALQGNVDSTAWFCGYFARAINHSEDNEKPHLIILLSKMLIKNGMEVFVDFSPYPGCRLMVINIEKFESLPPKVQALMQEAFDVNEASGKEVLRINDAILEELMVEK